MAGGHAAVRLDLPGKVATASGPFPDPLVALLFAQIERAPPHHRHSWPNQHPHMDGMRPLLTASLFKLTFGRKSGTSNGMGVRPLPLVAPPPSSDGRRPRSADALRAAAPPASRDWRRTAAAEEEATAPPVGRPPHSPVPEEGGVLAGWAAGAPDEKLRLRPPGAGTWWGCCTVPDLIPDVDVLAAASVAAARAKTREAGSICRTSKKKKCEKIKMTHHL